MKIHPFTMNCKIKTSVQKALRACSISALILEESELKSRIMKHNDVESWDDFINDQQMGDCQGISTTVSSLFGYPHVVGYFHFPSKVTVYDREEGRSYETNKIIHHWNLLPDGRFVDFSKGTLREVNEELESNGDSLYLKKDSIFVDDCSSYEFQRIRS